MPGFDRGAGCEGRGAAGGWSAERSHRVFQRGNTPQTAWLSQKLDLRSLGWNSALTLTNLPPPPDVARKKTIEADTRDAADSRAIEANEG